MYYVAISSNAKLPTVLDATFNADSTNTLVRLEPVDSLSRVVDDRIGSTSATSTASTSQQIFPGSNATQLGTSATPLTLGDLVMFVVGSPNDVPTELYTVNPFTGAAQTWITTGNAGTQKWFTAYGRPDGSAIS